jgi:hypothetical protein
MTRRKPPARLDEQAVRDHLRIVQAELDTLEQSRAVLLQLAKGYEKWLKVFAAQASAQPATGEEEV